MDLVVTALSRLVPGGVTRGELALDGGRRLRWVEAGAGTPAVVLVAGAGEVGLDWATVLPALAATSRVVAYDRAGLGASDPAPRVTVDAQVRDLAALLTAVGPAVLVGHSWGGALAEMTALAHPERVRGLVLVDPFHEDNVAEVPLRLRLASRAMLNGVVLLKAAGLFPRIARGMGRQLAARCTDDPALRELIADAYVSSYATIGRVAMIRAENRLGDRSVRELRAARGAATAPDVPMRILTAPDGKQPALRDGSEVRAARTAARFPRGEHVRVAGSGHYIHHDQPAAVVAAITEVRPT